ncbi:MAG: hypothetical protein ABIA93_01520 [Candidatus Woesearchaeota archaeon]
MHSAFAKESSISERFHQREALMKPFMKRFGEPVLVHAVDSEKSFVNILKSGKIKVPRAGGKTAYMDALLGIGPSIYFSVGFVYATAYGFPYNLVFRLSLLKELEYYKTSLSYSCYRAVMEYWYEQDKDYFRKVWHHDSETERVIRKYLCVPFQGKVRRRLDFWRIEAQLKHYIDTYPKKKVLLKLVSEQRSKLRIGIKKARFHAIGSLAKKEVPELMCDHDISLSNSAFVGIQIQGKISPRIKRLLSAYQSKLI